MQNTTAIGLCGFKTAWRKMSIVGISLVFLIELSVCQYCWPMEYFTQPQFNEKSEMDCPQAGDNALNIPWVNPFLNINTQVSTQSNLVHV